MLLSYQQAPMEDLSNIFNVNTIAPIWISGWALKQSSPEINIVNISSGAARSAYEGWGEYCSLNQHLKWHAKLWVLKINLTLNFLF